MSCTKEMGIHTLYELQVAQDRVYRCSGIWHKDNVIHICTQQQRRRGARVVQQLWNRKSNV
jgi:hypothetical protein